jgi:hypothetical protein
MRLIQLTTSGAAQQISPNLNGFNQSNQIYCSLLIIQNNGAGNIRVGDNTVSSSKGILISPSGGSLTANLFIVRGTMLAQWWIYGAASNEVDILYETSN